MRNLAALSLILLLPVQVRAQEHRSLWEQGRVVEALASIEALIGDSLDDELPLILRDYARLLFETGKVDRAIEVAEPLAQSFRSLTDRVRLAEYYRYRGLTADFDRILEQSLRVSRLMMRYGLDAENWIAVGRLMELDGVEPSRVLAHYKRLLDRQPHNLDGLIAAASIANSTRSHDVAARYYYRALEVDDTSQPALSGLALTLSRSHDPRSTTFLEKLAILNPDHPVLFELDAERHLDLGDTELALAAIERILEINPNHIDALSLKAAAYFLADDHDSVADTQKQILSINPTASQAFRVPGRIASRHYRFRQGKAFQQRALDIDPTDTEARLLLAFDHLRLGEDQAAQPELQHVFESDPYNVQAYNLLGVSDALKAFETLEDGIFRLQMPKAEAVVLAVDALALLHEAADLFQNRYKIALEKPVLVQMFDDHDEFIVRSVGLPGSAGHLGICFGKLITMDSPRARPPGSTNWRQVLWHEFVHVITLQKTSNRMPRWLSEGISVYEETRRDPSWGVKLDPQYKAIIDETGWPTLDTLERYFTRPESQNELIFGYFAAGEFISAYVAEFGLPSLVRALDLIGDGHASSPALEAAAGSTGADLDSLFEKHLQSRCTPLDHVVKRPGSKSYQLGKTFLNLMDEGDVYSKSHEHGLAEARYRQAHELYPDYHGRGAPLRKIVALWSDVRNPDRREEALKNLVAWDAQALDECLTLARLTSAPDTRAWALDRAFAVNPFDLDLLELRHEHHKSTGETRRSLADLDRLIHLDDGRRQSHRLARARLLAATGDTASAKTTLLTLLEQTPNDWHAQKLLLNLTESGTP